MKRRKFIQDTGLLGAGLLLGKMAAAQAGGGFPVVRTPVRRRQFGSLGIEYAINKFKSSVNDRELAWLFENCYPNTLDTTVFYTLNKGKSETYVITGDIDAMWLRDSSAQVWPYLTFIGRDEKLRLMIAGVINTQVQFIQRDPYANAFYRDVYQVSQWKSDLTEMKPGVHERKWEVDSLCYPIRLAYGYWKACGDRSPFTEEWKDTVRLILRTFRQQQRKHGQGPYHFQRPGGRDYLAGNGYGVPVKPTGLICSMFRPSDDAVIYPYLVPSNFFAVVSLKQAAEMVTALFGDHPLAGELKALSKEVETALRAHAVYKHPEFGSIYGYEVDGLGNFNLMDDANVPSLVSLPYLNAVPVDDPIYQNTRRFALSDSNPYFYKGKIAEGIGGPHVGKPGMIWPIGITIRGLTSTDDAEIKQCIQMLKRSNAGTGFMHESFYKDNTGIYTRKWFAWSNTLFGEFLWKLYLKKPHLLNT